MNLNSTTIDRIVANVLSQISPAGRIAQVDNSSPQKDVDVDQVVRLTDRVITAESLESFSTRQTIGIHPRAIITPAAYDLIRERQLSLTKSAEAKRASGLGSKSEINFKISCAIVRHSEAVARVLEDIISVKKELVSCPDDAAKYAISEICRGAAATVLIFAEQTHRAACLANRNEQVKAVIARDSSDVAAVRKQLRANVWCLDPSDRSYFELKNLLKTITR